MTKPKTIEEAEARLKTVTEAIDSKLKAGESIDNELQQKADLLKERTDLIAGKLGLVRTVVMQVLGIPAKMVSTKGWVEDFKGLPLTEQVQIYNAAHKAAIELGTTLRMEKDLEQLEK